MNDNESAIPGPGWLSIPWFPASPARPVRSRRVVHGRWYPETVGARRAIETGIHGHGARPLYIETTTAPLYTLGRKVRSGETKDTPGGGTPSPTGGAPGGSGCVPGMVPWPVKGRAGGASRRCQSALRGRMSDVRTGPAPPAPRGGAGGSARVTFRGRQRGVVASGVWGREPERLRLAVARWRALLDIASYWRAASKSNRRRIPAWAWLRG